eukprot:451727-Pleurochrysis_carterae.AAC.3
MEAWMAGMKDVLEPCFVLLLAWALGEVVGLVRTADFLAGALHAGMPRWALPTLITVLAHAISYACGSSFGTMAIILPLVGPLAMKLGGGRDYLLHCIGSVLGGAVFGNICSPISDTTILTVLATKCDLQAHVRTITPYTLVVATIALGLGSVPVGLGIYGPMCGLAVGTAVLGGLVAWTNPESVRRFVRPLLLDKHAASELRNGHGLFAFLATAYRASNFRLAQLVLRKTIQNPLLTPTFNSEDGGLAGSTYSVA